MTRRTSLELELSKARPNNAADFGQFGNAAAMREALEHASYFLRRHYTGAVYAPDGETLIYCEDVAKIVDAALSAPPRNCDRFATVKDAAIAFARERQDAPQPCPDFTFSAWLFALATEKEGGAK